MLSHSAADTLDSYPDGRVILGSLGEWILKTSTEYGRSPGTPTIPRFHPPGGDAQQAPCGVAEPHPSARRIGRIEKPLRQA